ncbi:Rieske (2Fe-2S) protein [Methanolobus sp. ZRKC2]|uniref:Rieske (2Fe-2S) protein n=1 Tax=Methanolobus sp. ZRKC2 TaxID=3125783 RepID=UPI00242078E3|nr:Rieske (2Fe-2S) protein [Bacillota bacterium]
MSEWITAFEESKLKEGKIKIFKGKDKQIALIRKGDDVYAFLNECPHEGCPLKSGTLDGYVLKCACHNWGFDIRNGENVDTGEYVDMEDPRVETFKTQVSAGNIEILI